MARIASSLDEFCSQVQTRPSVHVSDDCPWCNGNEYHSTHSSLALHREILDFTRWILPTEEEKHLRQITIRRFRNAILLLWPEARVVVTGSTATGAFIPGADIDIVVVNVPQSDNDSVAIFLNDLNTHLDRINLFRKSEVISKARCPIIKAVEKPFGFHLDISINQPNSVSNIPRNLALMEHYPALLPLFMIVKFFLFQNHLNEPFHGGISSNTSIHLTLFAIQTTPLAYQNNLGKLLPHFLKLYGFDFNFLTLGLSTRGGGTVYPRSSVNQIDWHTMASLSVENPQEPGNFLGNNCFQTDEFHNVCASAYQSLMSEGRNEQSILLRIFRRPDWIIQHRNELHRQYQSLIGEAVDSFSLHPKEERKDRRNDRPNQRNDRYNQRNDRSDQRNSRYDQRNDRHDQRNDRYDQRNDRYDQRNDRYDQRSDRNRDSSRRNFYHSDRPRPYMH